MKLPNWQSLLRAFIAWGISHDLHKTRLGRRLTPTVRAFLGSNQRFLSNPTIATSEPAFMGMQDKSNLGDRPKGEGSYRLTTTNAEAYLINHLSGSYQKHGKFRLSHVHKVANVLVQHFDVNEVTRKHLSQARQKQTPKVKLADYHIEMGGEKFTNWHQYMWNSSEISPFISSSLNPDFKLNYHVLKTLPSLGSKGTMKKTLGTATNDLRIKKLKNREKEFKKVNGYPQKWALHTYAIVFEDKMPRDELEIFRELRNIGCVTFMSANAIPTALIDKSGEWVVVSKNISKVFCKCDFWNRLSTSLTPQDNFFVAHLIGVEEKFVCGIRSQLFHAEHQQTIQSLIETIKASNPQRFYL